MVRRAEATEQERRMMECLKWHITSGAVWFVFPRQSGYGAHIDVFIWYPSDNISVDFKLDGSFFPEKDEEWFDSVCHAYDQELVSSCAPEDLYNLYNNIYPEWKLVPYNDINRMIHHIYYARHWNSKGVLYREKLGYLAFHLDAYSKVNELGSNSSEIFDGVPKDIIKKMNDNEDTYMLRTYERRRALKSLYDGKR